MSKITICPLCGTPNGWHVSECDTISPKDRAEVRGMMLRYGAVIAEAALKDTKGA